MPHGNVTNTVMRKRVRRASCPAGSANDNGWADSDSDDSDYSETPPKQLKSSSGVEVPEFKRGTRSRAAGEHTENEPSSNGAILPDDTLVLIFRHVVSSVGCVPFLLRAARVCKQWQRLCDIPTLWTKFFFECNCGTAGASSWDVKAYLKLVSSHANMSTTHLCFIGKEFLLQDVLKIVKKCSKLLVLNVSCPKISPGVLFNALCSDNSSDVICPKLQTIVVSWPKKMPKNKSFVLCSTLNRFLEEHSSVKELTLANYFIGDLSKSLCFAENLGHQLRVLDISGCFASKDWAGGIVVDLKTLSCLPNLEQFIGNNGFFHWVYHREDGQPVLPVCNSLRRIELSVCDGMICMWENHGCMINFLRDCAHLEIVHLNGHVDMKYKEVQSLCKLPLVELCVSECWNIAIAPKEDNTSYSAEATVLPNEFCASIETLDVSGISGGMFIKTVFETIFKASTLQTSNLRVLHLVGSSVSKNLLMDILKYCKKLEVLDISSCRKLNPRIRRRYSSKVDENGKFCRLREECQQQSCGAGVFMAAHFDRYNCGKCYSTMICTDPKDKKPPPQKPTEAAAADASGKGKEGTK